MYMVPLVDQRARDLSACASQHDVFVENLRPVSVFMQFQSSCSSSSTFSLSQSRRVTWPTSESQTHEALHVTSVMSRTPSRGPNRTEQNRVNSSNSKPFDALLNLLATLCKKYQDETKICQGLRSRTSLRANFCCKLAISSENDLVRDGFLGVDNADELAHDQSQEVSLST
jgi:hypothetical protein